MLDKYVKEDCVIEKLSCSKYLSEKQSKKFNKLQADQKTRNSIIEKYKTRNAQISIISSTSNCFHHEIVLTNPYRVLFDTVEMDMDHNCFFRSVAFQLKQFGYNAENHRMVRKEVTEYLSSALFDKNHPDYEMLIQYCKTFLIDETLDQIITRISTESHSKGWVGLDYAIFVSNALKISIVTFDSNREYHVLQYMDQSNPIIYLEFLSEKTHYNVLVPKEPLSMVRIGEVTSCSTVEITNPVSNDSFKGFLSNDELIVFNELKDNIPGSISTNYMPTINSTSLQRILKTGIDGWFDDEVFFRFYSYF